MNRKHFILFITLLTPLYSIAQWQPQSVGTDASFRAVSAANAEVVWIGGTKGTFVRTADGGRTWQTGTVPDAQTCDFRDVHAVDAQTAYFMSAGPAENGQACIYKTTDAGQTWALLYKTDQKGIFFDGIDFWDNQHGIVFSDPIDGRWAILTTDDGGKTWQAVPPAALPLMQPNEAAFAASGTSLVVEGKRNVWIASGGGLAGRVFHSRDRGKTWTVSNTPLPGGEATGLFGMRFFSDKVGVVVGGNYKQESQPGPNVAISRDGGQTWQTVAQTDPAGLKEAVALLPGDRLLTIGPSGTSLSADQGQTWQKLDTEGFHSMACVKGTCYAVGAKGKVSKQVFK
ncbi:MULTISPECIES: YCF48-related protein [unclassified Spirosoma]|uniref:WD40/YVTN/BNR-like repeat-containing protein n=1 Tax=unclassified Spirosoma TaxID=2621999 RepID=UPI000965729C|nr:MULTISPECIES: YCF48-related protein [unclassified Spirosoma]MBN8824243.1 oxidoreductase [Spirosoma sp.]OJW78973.1 MAG: oxidoreductase [Spirosoma sp. 48-14]